jgi:hypothetical protein
LGYEKKRCARIGTGLADRHFSRLRLAFQRLDNADDREHEYKRHAKRNFHSMPSQFFVQCRDVLLSSRAGIACRVKP